VLGQRRGGEADDVVDTVAAGPGQYAELVAADPVGPALPVDLPGQGGAQARQQGVAGGVAEGVVVRLEAVEIAQHQQQRIGVRGAIEVGVEVGDQAPPVVQAGQGIGVRRVDQGLLPAAQRDQQKSDENEGGEHDHERQDPTPVTALVALSAKDTTYQLLALPAVTPIRW
jgi:hypothetical protein